MRIIHTEASKGMGGQEIRILREAIGMRKRGHKIYFAVQKGGALVAKARAEGFRVYECDFRKRVMPVTLITLLLLMIRHRIQIINTHSSLDAWQGGIAGKLTGCFVIRTRHLSTPIRKGLNSKILYNKLACHVVTTCQEAKEMIHKQAALPEKRVISIPTGVDPDTLRFDPAKVAKFRSSLGVGKEDLLIGTCCVLRGWKGIYELLHAAKLLEELPHLKWLVVGGGVSEDYFKGVWRELGLEKRVFFTGHLEPPTIAMAALDLFLLLSWGNEGVSQASLQAAYLQKPLITTKVGGLPEVCQPGITGLQVEAKSPRQVADAVLQLINNEDLRKRMGESAKSLVEREFTYEKMLDEMESLYRHAKCRR